MRREDASRGARVRVDGKFLRAGEAKFWMKGVTYGPFGQRADGLFLPEPAQMAKDLAQIRGLGANTIRVYHPPTRGVLDLAHAHGLKVLVDVPWSKHRCFMESREDQESGRRAVRAAARMGKGHPAVLAYSVVNEIPADVARWEGHAKVERFVEELVDIAKQEDPEALATFASYPPTEYLHPRNVDFYTMNVYLHARDKFRSYLQRLQNLADEKPMVLGEYGIDSMRHGETEQAELVAMHLEEVFRCGLSGTCVFSYTDEWFTGGCAITDWAFGLVRADRGEKPVFAEVAKVYRADPRPRLPRYPKVSVVVCSYNGGRTLDGCLQSLQKVDYPDYEVVLVNDGSTDDVPDIAARYEPWVRVYHQENKGLSAARNVGMEVAEGEIIVYTDDDCFVDEDWLYYLVSKLLETKASGVGGPNLLPEKDGPVAACVSASPGTPAHILMDDTVAEHVPGCNMAFWADRLRNIKGFDPVYRAAGDDVDLCWRLQNQGDFIVYAPAAMVWHHRRATVNAYLKQQRGYGIAEALLKRKHPDKFRGFRADLSWAGRIYTRAGLGLLVGRPVIHYGLFGAGLFQTIYSPPMVWWPLMVVSLEWWLAIVALLGLSLVIHPTVVILKSLPQGPLVESLVFGQLRNPFFFLPVLMLLTTLAVAYRVAGQASPPLHQRRWWSRLADRRHAHRTARGARLGPVPHPVQDHRDPRGPSRAPAHVGATGVGPPGPRPPRALERVGNGPGDPPRAPARLRGRAGLVPASRSRLVAQGRALLRRPVVQARPHDGHGEPRRREAPHPSSPRHEAHALPGRPAPAPELRPPARLLVEPHRLPRVPARAPPHGLAARLLAPAAASHRDGQHPRHRGAPGHDGRGRSTGTEVPGIRG